ncbi:hypothetical protein [Nostoc edaphicum]|uniref:hypothetical protein n=1 Tax=Nostoc edaphicum TaxID=264686 RepID=UPI003B82EBAE
MFLQNPDRIFSRASLLLLPLLKASTVEEVRHFLKCDRVTIQTKPTDVGFKFFESA